MTDFLAEEKPDPRATPDARLEIWDSAERDSMGVWRKRRLLRLRVRNAHGPGSCFWLEERLPLTERTALRIAATVARLIGQSSVVWNSPVRRSVRCVDGVRIGPEGMI